MSISALELTGNTEKQNGRERGKSEAYQKSQVIIVFKKGKFSYYIQTSFPFSKTSYFRTVSNLSKSLKQNLSNKNGSVHFT